MGSDRRVFQEEPRLKLYFIIAALLVPAAALAQAPEARDPLEQANALQQQAKQLLNSGRAAEAVPLERRALAIYEKAYAGDQRMQTYYIVAANTEKYAGNYDEAVRLLERAGVVAVNFGSTARASVDMHISQVRFQQRRYEEAITLLRGVIAAYEQKFGANHLALAVPYNEMANSLRALGRLQEADAAMARAIDLTERGRARPALSP